MGIIEMFSPTYFPVVMEILSVNSALSYSQPVVMVMRTILLLEVVIVIVAGVVLTLIHCRKFGFSI